MRLTKALGMAGALILAAIVGGTLIGSAFATDETESPATGGEVTDGRGEYCDVFMDALASELGTDRDGLTAAGKAAANAAVDAAVAAGDLTEERAAEIRERIESFEGEGCGAFRLGFGRGFHLGWENGMDRGAVRGFIGGDVFEAAADALGIESADLIGQLRDAGSLQALADELGASYDEVKAAILAAVQADLDAAVAEGLSQERADAVIERLTTWLDEGGEVGAFGRGGPHGGFGPGHLHGPWGDGATEEETETEESGRSSLGA